MSIAKPKIICATRIGLGAVGMVLTSRLLVVIIPTMNSAELIKKLTADGWVLRSVRGSHHVYSHPVRGGHLSVPHPKKDLGIGLVRAILKQAGLR